MAGPLSSTSLSPVRTFHPRRSRMGAQKRAALADLLPRYEWVPGRDPLPLGDVMMEIGFGMGDATVVQAAAHPAITWLAVDIHTPGVAHLCRELHKQGLTNVRICVDDALDVLDAHIPDDSLSGVQVLFPDPWPKVRHRIRRLIQPMFLDLVAPRMRVDALLHVATDWDDYAVQMATVIGAHHAFEVVAAPPRPQTKYEAMGIAAGRTITDVAALRRR